jgi:hypothetical protein
MLSVMGPVRKAREAAETIKTAAHEASGFAWAILGLAAAALLLGAVALYKATRSA